MCTLTLIIPLPKNDINTPRVQKAQSTKFPFYHMCDVFRICSTVREISKFLQHVAKKVLQTALRSSYKMDINFSDAYITPFLVQHQQYRAKQMVFRPFIFLEGDYWQFILNQVMDIIRPKKICKSKISFLHSGRQGSKQWSVLFYVFSMTFLIILLS